MMIHQLELGPMQNFVYLLGCEKTREAAVVDPAWDVPAILKAAKDNDLKIRTILLTHTHFDHINGVEELLKETDARVFVHKKEAAVLQYAASSVKKIDSGDSVSIGGLDVTFIHTPGHTPGSISLYFKQDGILIVGDALEFRHGKLGLPSRLFTTDMTQAKESIRRLARLDFDTLCFSHFPPLRNGASRAMRTFADTID